MAALNAAAVVAVRPPTPRSRSVRPKNEKLTSAAMHAWQTMYVAFRGYRRATACTPPSKYSVEIPNQTGDEGGRARVCPPEFGTAKLDAVKNDTVWSMFQSVAKRIPDAPCHGTLQADKTWSWVSYADVLADIKVLAAGLSKLGLFSPAKGDASIRVFGLFGPNTSTWMRVEYAALACAVTTVPLYTTLNKEGLVHCINLTGVGSIYCATPAMALRVVDAKPECPSLGYVVMDSANDEVAALAAKAGVRVVTLAEARSAGKDAPLPVPPTPLTFFTFCFTSGSTGPPKGALLTHANIMHNLTGIMAMINLVPDQALEFGEVWYLSFLPIAHQLERTMQAMCYSIGARIGFARGDPLLIMEDIALLRPTLLAAVPRILVRLHDGLRLKMREATGAKKTLLETALSAKLYDLTAYGHVKHPVWDRIVFNGIAAKLGLDRVRYVATGSAPIAPRVLDFLRVVLRTRVNEGYGLTEVTCCATLAHGYHVGGSEERISHVGGPMPGSLVKLVSLPHMEYLVSDRAHGSVKVVGRGEVCIRGPFNMDRYFGMKEKTDAVIDADGWFRTGDVGAWLPDGTLTILDRANNIFKVAQGEYVCPDKIERAIARCPVVVASFVFGTTLNAKLVAIVVVGPDFAKWCAAKGVDAANRVDATKLLLAQVKAACHEAVLMGFEIPQAVTYTDQPFTTDSGVLTPTFKIVRNVAKKFYQADLVRMFKELGEEVKI